VPWRQAHRGHIGEAQPGISRPAIASGGGGGRPGDGQGTALNSARRRLIGPRWPCSAISPRNRRCRHASRGRLGQGLVFYLADSARARPLLSNGAGWQCRLTARNARNCPEDRLRAWPGMPRLRPTRSRHRAMRAAKPMLSAQLRRSPRHAPASCRRLVRIDAERVSLGSAFSSQAGQQCSPATAPKLAAIGPAGKNRIGRAASTGRAVHRDIRPRDHGPEPAVLGRRCRPRRPGPTRP